MSVSIMFSFEMPMFATMKPAYKCISTISNKYFTELEDENLFRHTIGLNIINQKVQ